MNDVSSAIITSEIEQYGRTERRQHVDVRKFWDAGVPHLPGTWTIIKERIDDCLASKAVRFLSVENEKGVKLWLSAHGKGYAFETHVNVSIDSYEHEAGPYKGRHLDTRYWFPDRRDPRASIDPTKRNAKAFAGNILRKVVKPFEEFALPKLLEQRKTDSVRQQSQDEGREALEAAGLKVRAHYCGEGKTTADLVVKGRRYTLIASSGGIQLEREIHIQPKQLPKLLEFLKSLES